MIIVDETEMTLKLKNKKENKPTMINKIPPIN